MRPRRFRLWLLLALAAGLGSCEINPQPGLPDSSEDNSPGVHGPGKGGATMTGEGPQAGSSSSGGGLVLNPSGGTFSGGGPVIGLGGANDAAGGEGPGQPGAGGAGGANEPGGAGGAGGEPQ